jgi:hypothetical protein
MDTLLCGLKVALSFVLDGDEGTHVTIAAGHQSGLLVILLFSGYWKSFAILCVFFSVG